jgi:hypothetical protein
MTALHATLDPWLGEPRRKQAQGGVTFIYRFDSEVPPVTPLRLKVEINTREHFAVCGFVRQRFEVGSPWFSGAADVVTYSLEELLATKLRALYQRKEGRDLYDLATALTKASHLDVERTIQCFLQYMSRTGARISRAEYQANLLSKVADPVFLADVDPLLATQAAARFDAGGATAAVMEHFIARLPGDPWKRLH